MFVVQAKGINTSELDPGLLLSALQEAENKAKAERAIEEAKAAPKKLSPFGVYMHAPELQNTMLKLLGVHIILSFLEMSLSFFYNKSGRTLKGIYLITVTIMVIESFIMILFPIETLLKAYTSLEGLRVYFKDKGNLASLLFLFVLSMCDIVEIFLDILFFRLVLPLIGFRVLRGFRTIYMYYATKIEREYARTSVVQDEYDALYSEYKEKLGRNKEVRRAIDEAKDRIEEIHDESNDLFNSVVATQEMAWARLVPPTNIVRFQPGAGVADIQGVDLASKRRRELAGLPLIDYKKK